MPLTRLYKLMTMITRGYETVYQKSYSLAMEIFEITKIFPKEEKYTLVDQIRRSSKSVPANIFRPVKYT